MSRRVKLPKINISNLSLFEEDEKGNLTFTKNGTTYMMKYQPSRQKFTWRPQLQFGSGSSSSPSPILEDDDISSVSSSSSSNLSISLANTRDAYTVAQKGGARSPANFDFEYSNKSSFKENLLFWLLLRQKSTSSPPSDYPPPDQTGGMMSVLHEACARASEIVNSFDQQTFQSESFHELYASFQKAIISIDRTPDLEKCNIVDQIYDDLTDIYTQKKTKLMTELRQKQQQNQTDPFNETQKFGYFFGVYRGNRYSKMTFYKTYRCLNDSTRVTVYGHVNDEEEVIKFMDDDFLVRLCNQLTISSPSLNKIQTILVNYLDLFTRQEKINSKGSLVFYIDDFVFLVSLNQNVVETKVLGPKAPIRVGTPLSKGRVKSKGFHKKDLPPNKTYNIVLGSHGFWKVNRPGMVESVWGLMTGNSNFEELIGVSSEEDRRRICQKLVREAARQNPKEDVALIYADLCKNTQ